MNAALICLREERLRVRDVARTLELDSHLRLYDPKHHRQLLDQAWREIRELTAAIDFLRAPPGSLPFVAPPEPAPESPSEPPLVVEEPSRPRVTVEAVEVKRAPVPASERVAEAPAPRRDLGLVRRFAA